MFHHFHSAKHPQGQGSISGDTFVEMIAWLEQRYRLLDADVYLDLLLSEKLEEGDICLTFDDALLCQTDIARPVLEQKGIKAFFFIYSSPFLGEPDSLEIYRYFRNCEFENVDGFYEQFFEEAYRLFNDRLQKEKAFYDNIDFLSHFPFYSENDKWFRYVRDQILGKAGYDRIMASLMEKHRFNPRDVMDKLWMRNEDLINLDQQGHVVGLHSFTHPTTLHRLAVEQQREEYEKNLVHLTKVLEKKPIAMSHPCGNYSDLTLDILREQGILIGFRSNMSIRNAASNLEIPREDHANVLREMRS